MNVDVTCPSCTGPLDTVNEGTTRRTTGRSSHIAIGGCPSCGYEVIIELRAQMTTYRTVQHGSHHGYRWHVGAGEEACPECAEWHKIQRRQERARARA